MLLPTVNRATLGVEAISIARGGRVFMNDGELEVLVALVRRVNPRVMIEVGVNEGRTAKAMLLNVPTLMRYVGIDIPAGSRPSLRIQRGEVPTCPGVHAIADRRFELLLRPMGSLNLLAQDLPKCDAMFIDGDHGRRAVTHDSELARKLVRPGGVIVWHDYHAEGTVEVKPVLEALHAAGQRIQHVAGTWLAFQSVE